MFQLKHLKRALTIAAPILALGLLSCDVSLAQKKGGGGGGNNTGGGTIYFYSAAGFGRMNSDGSGKTALPIPAGEPSRLLHAGHRWFLRMVTVAGNYPDGRQREEIFAYRDDGVSFQLTNDPDLEYTGTGSGYGAADVRWQPGDGAISWVAKRWDSETGVVVEAGIYEAQLAYNGSGNLAGVVPGSVLLLLPEASIGSHDWSPDGTRIVYDLQTTNELWIADRVNDEIDLLYAGPANQAVWSPDGSTIAFHEAVFRGDIMTIKSDGSGLSTILVSWGNGFSTAKQISRPNWSPTGSHLIYSVWWNEGFASAYNDVYRATANGSGKSNLTPESDFATPIGWR